MDLDSALQQTYAKVLPGQKPAQHQEEAWHGLAEGKCILLRAPTGSGKTEAVVLPFLESNDGIFPSRLLYALPLRSLANQMVERIRHYAQALKKPADWRVRLQHGESPESVLFAADAIVATIDQVITSYACTPLTLPVRHGNIPAGAVMSSFLVFDEMHLFDPELGLQATRLICERLGRVGLPYAVLSATLPDSVLEFWHNTLNAEVIDAPGEFCKRNVSMRWHGEKLTAQTVIQALETLEKEDPKIIVVCNTVSQAIQVFKDVTEKAQKKGYCCDLLHSRFLPEDRKRKETWALSCFGKGAPRDKKALLVATQVVEVGLDISCDCLLTELAPVDALIQRAGRVARWGGSGAVRVYDVKTHAPYRKDLVEKTRNVLSQKQDGQKKDVQIDWNMAKQWVNEILNDPYKKILQDDNVYEQVVADLSRAAFEGDRVRAEKAVREVNTVEVTIHSHPQNLGLSVLRLPTISVHLGVVKEFLKVATQKKQAVFRVDVDHDGPGDTGPQVQLKRVTEKTPIVLGDRLVFPSSVLQYSPEFGLDRGEGEQDFIPEHRGTHPLLESNLRKEMWEEHAVSLIREVSEILQSERRAVTALAKILEIDPAQIHEAVKCSALVHDLGKLTLEWQNRAGVGEGASKGELLAHTGETIEGAFPPHATVSAYALWDVFCSAETLPRVLVRPLLLAVAHHHSVRAKVVPAYRLHPAWKEILLCAAEEAGVTLNLPLEQVVTTQRSQTELRDSFPPLEYEKLYTAYILFSRWLRLADRLATGGSDALLRYEDWFGLL